MRSVTLKRIIFLSALVFLAQAPAFGISCPERFAAVAKRLAEARFDSERFAAEFNQQIFKDKNGEPFRFGKMQPVTGGLHKFDITVEHSSLGRLTGDVGGGLFLDSAGNLHGTSWLVMFYKGKDRGLLSALFSYFESRLPEGARLALVDASDTQEIIFKALKITDSKIAEFASKDPEGQKLLKLYQELNPGAVNWTGFKRYMYDLFSIWGRIARKGGFRGDYSREQKDAEQVFFKRRVPEEIRAEETRIVRQGMPEELRRLIDSIKD